MQSVIQMVRPFQGAPRWPYIIPGVIPLLFIGHAIEDAGHSSAVVLGAFSVLCVAQAIWPTILGWVIIFAPFLGFAIMVALSRGSGPVGEWILFMMFGFVPAVLLWLGRPWRAVGLKNL